MKKFKNIVMILVLLLSLGGLVFGIFTIKRNMNHPSEMSSNVEVPEKPSAEEPPEKPADEMKKHDEMQQQSMTNISTTDYLVLGVFSLIFSLDLMYLILSKLNSVDAFAGSKKIVFVLGLLVLTGLLVFASIYVINNNFNKVEEKNGNNETLSYSGNTVFNTSTTENEKEYSSTTSNQNAVLVSGEVDVNISNSSLNKTGDSNSGDNASFYGINSGILAKDKAKLHIDNMTITTDAKGANGVFNFGGSATTNNTSGDGTTITITNSRIKTAKDNSGGIMVTGGGNISAVNLDIETSGVSSAAIRSDRGGGTIDVTLGSYKTAGAGSPTIYSTADINVSSATLVSTASEGVIIEGANSINLNKVTLVDTNEKLNGQSTTYKNIFIYQSMSGDAKEGSATFKSTESMITTNKGDTIYVTNTKATIELTKNTFINNDSEGNFIRIQKDSWGKSGSNGGDVTLTLTEENIKGNIVVDSISTLNMTLNKSSLETTINNKDEAKSIVLNIDKDSKLKLTGDTYITDLVDEDITYSNIDLNGYKLYVNKKELKKDA